MFNTPTDMSITLLPTNGYFTVTRRMLADVIFPEGRNLRNQLERAANVDELTGIANKRAFMLAQPSAELDSNTAFIIFDANNFKTVNDVLGHIAGDNVLTRIADTMTKVASTYALAERCFRIGGDEFAIICPVGLAETLRSEIEGGFDPFILNSRTVSITGTIGSTFNEADNQLQARKAARKNAR